MPSPQPTCRPLTFSPVPTQITSGLVGSIEISPIEYEGWSSKTALQVVPAFVVFQTPPEPAATYQVLRSRGCTAISAIRPLMMAGPMLLSLSAAAALATAAVSAPWADTETGARDRTASEKIPRVLHVMTPPRSVGRPPPARTLPSGGAPSP